MSETGIGSGLGIAKMININNIVKQQTKPLKNKIVEKTSENNQKFQEISAYNQLERLLTNFKESTKGLSSGYNSYFTKKIPSYSTTDIGSAEDYIDILPKEGSTNNSFDVQVKQLSKPSSITLINGSTNQAFNFENAGYEGDIDITIGTSVAQVKINAGASVSDMIDSINAALKRSNLQAEAFFVKNADANTASISIMAKEGEYNNISVNCTGTQDDYRISSTSSSHQKAKIVVNGEELTSDSNKFLDALSGIDIEVKKANTGNGQQTVKMIADPRKFTEIMSKVIGAYNDLQAFVSHHSASEVTDPNDPNKTVTPPLNGSDAISKTKEIILEFTSKLGNNSLEENLGFSFETDLNRTDAPAGTKFINISDYNKFESAIKNLEKINSLFANTSSVTAKGESNNSTLDVKEISGKLPTYLQGKPIDINITLGSQGGVSAVQAILPDGSTINGNYDAATREINFINNPPSLLQNLKFDFSDGNETNKTIQFSVVVSNGLADLSLEKLKPILDSKYDIGGKILNTIGIAIDKAQKQILNQGNEIQKIEGKINEIKSRADGHMTSINQMDILSGMMVQAIKDMFGLGQ